MIRGPSLVKLESVSRLLFGYLSKPFTAIFAVSFSVGGCLRRPTQILLLFALIAIQASGSTLFIDEDLRHLGLSPLIIERFPGPKSASIYSTSRSPEPLTDLKFGVLTQFQFSGLMKFYRNISRVSYDPKREYYLSDFLSPQMQALLGSDFDSEPTQEDLPKFYEFLYEEDGIELDETTPFKVLSTAQCWGTAWNNIVSLQSLGLEPMPFEIGMPSKDHVLQYLLSDDYSVSHQGTPPRFADLVAMVTRNQYGHITPVHFAIYIGFGLVFEKEDSLIGAPYRTVPYETSVAGLKMAVKNSPYYTGHTVEVQFRRFLGVNKPALPKISKAASLWSKEGFQIFGRKAARLLPYIESGLGGRDIPLMEKITRIAFLIDSNGRGRINPKSKAYFLPAYQRKSHCRESLKP